MPSVSPHVLYTMHVHKGSGTTRAVVLSPHPTSGSAITTAHRCTTSFPGHSEGHIQCTLIHTHTHTHTHAHTRTHTHAHAHTQIHTHTNMHTTRSRSERRRLTEG